MRALVTFALPAEFAPWRERHGFRRHRHTPQESLPADGDHVYEGHVGDWQVDVVLTGVGCRAARSALQHKLQADCAVCVSTGLAGGLRSGLRIGEIAVARRVVARSTGARLAGSVKLVDAAAAFGARLVDVCVTSDVLVATAMEKRELAAIGDVVDMESYHVLRAAARARVPAVVVRAISDTVDEDLPMNFDRLLDPAGEVSVRRLLGSLARQPRKIPALARFGKRSRRAAEALADFLDRYIGALDQSPELAKNPAAREAAQ